MAENSKIEWCDATVNFWWGCTKVSPGCKNCYADTLSHRWGKDIWGPGKPREDHRKGATKLALSLERKAAEQGKRLRVFCSSMADWLDPEVPIEWLADLLDLIRRTQHLDWLLLTKRPELWRERMRQVYQWWERTDPFPGKPSVDLIHWTGNWTCDWPWKPRKVPANVWIGTSVEDQQRADERIPQLLAIPAVVRFLSCEPLLGPVDIEEHLEDLVDGGYVLGSAPIHWVICGGESGPNARPMHPDWARSMRDQCKAAKVPFLFKQWGEWLPGCQYQEGDRERLRERAQWTFDENNTSWEVGKKNAGRLLDGVEHNEFPEVRP